MWDTPNDHSRGHSRTLVRTTILVVAYLTTIPNLMPNRMSLLPFHLQLYVRVCSLRRLIPAELADWSVWGIQSTETGLLPAAKIDCTGT